MNTPFGEIEYTNELCVIPFNVTVIGLPELSKISIRPCAVLLFLLTSAICVAHPPAIANCGTMMAELPEDTAVPVTDNVLKSIPEKRKTSTANGVELWT